MEQSISVPRNTDTLFPRAVPQGMKKVMGKMITELEKTISSSTKNTGLDKGTVFIFNITGFKRLVSII